MCAALRAVITSDFPTLNAMFGHSLIQALSPTSRLLWIRLMQQAAGIPIPEEVIQAHAAAGREPYLRELVDYELLVSDGDVLRVMPPDYIDDLCTLREMGSSTNSWTLSRDRWRNVARELLALIIRSAP